MSVIISICLSTSDWDLETCLQRECTRKRIRKPEFFNQWADVKLLYKVQSFSHSFCTEIFFTYLPVLYVEAVFLRYYDHKINLCTYIKINLQFCSYMIIIYCRNSTSESQEA